MYIEGNSQPKYAMYNSMRACICMCMYVYANVYNNVSRLMCWWRWGGDGGGRVGWGGVKGGGEAKEDNRNLSFQHKRKY